MSQILNAATLAAALAAASSADVVPDRATLDAILGDTGVLEDFESYDIGPGDADNLDTPSLDHLTITNGQGPALVQPGATYADASGVRLQWNGDGYFGTNSKTLLANGTGGSVVIIYDQPVRAMGLDVLGFQGFGWAGSVYVYGVGGALLGEVPVSIVSGGPERAFAGWEDGAGIVRAEISSADYTYSPIIDDHLYGVPTPSTLAALGVGALAISRRRR